MPLIRRIPKRGFNRKADRVYSIVNIDILDKSFQDNDVVTKQALIEKGIIKGSNPVKVLGNGAISKKLTVKVEAFSSSAKEKITGAKGTIEVV